MRTLSRLVVIAAGLGIAAGLYLVAKPREPALLLPPEEAQELVVMIRPGPVVYFPGPDGVPTGLDVELARQFASEKNIPLRFVLADSAAAVIAAVAEGRAHIGAGGLYRPLSPTGEAPPAVVAPDKSGTAATWTAGYATAEPVVIYNRDGYKPRDWRDLDGETIAYVGDDADFEPELAAVRTTHPGIVWQRLLQPTAALISQISDGTLDYGIIGSIAVAVARNVYLDFEVAFAAGARRDLAWVVSPRAPDLRQQLDAFLARIKRDGTLARLVERYLPDTRTIPRIDAGVLHERVRTVLPQYRSLFQSAQERTGIEWRLLAAMAYQESQWDPGATSETGVRGFMQITEDTAKRLGISNLLDPAQSVLGAARYLRELKDKLPARIPEPERTWLALAAFNIGLGHIEDARVLAQRQKLNPDLWTDVKKVLPLLALPEYFEKAKQGYARGGMPVAFVDRVRGYYDVLLAQEKLHAPRLRRFTDAPEREPVPPDRETVKK